MKITDVICHVLLDPGFNRQATDSAQDDLVVEIHTDAGLVGIGETDTNPHVARACIESRGTHTMGLGLKEMLLGADPLDIETLWQRLYVGSAMTGRLLITCYRPDEVYLGHFDGQIELFIEDPTHELLISPINAALHEGKLYLANFGGRCISMLDVGLHPGPIHRPKF